MTSFRSPQSPASGVQSEPLVGDCRSAVRISVRGQVQGVGFRPFVVRLARRCRLHGRVRNTCTGVVIEVEGPRQDLSRFRELLVSEAPANAVIDGLVLEKIEPAGHRTFLIEASGPRARPEVRVPRDLAICAACRQDVLEYGNRRRGYPFTNCTACGPRYSILSALPYDRPGTTMVQFRMCAECQAEYYSSEDRRFHAEPNGCAVCGPQIGLWDNAGRTIAAPDAAIRAAAQLLRRGEIVALKGLGGFQLLVRADDSAAVRRLRERKNRPSKPLAVMVSSLAFAKKIAIFGPQEQDVLRSAQNPIVLLQQRIKQKNSISAKETGEGLAAEVAPRVGTVGVFLPTTPLHQLLLANLDFPIVVTSGNRSEEPIVTDERDAVQRLAGIADAFLVHDRPIFRGVDDSVVRVIAGQPVTVRLARGLAPLPLQTLEAFAKARACSPILATGGHQKNAIAIWTGAQAVLAQHVGDLDHAETRAGFARVTKDLTSLYQFEPAALACDLHPGYFTTQWAFTNSVSVIQVQHHHAHAVACMAEHDLLDRDVLAFTWDGTGYGPDETIWGGEVLKAQCAGFSRVASLLPFPLPGGELAIRRPNRTAFGLLWLLLGEDALLHNDHLLERLGILPREMRVLAAMIRRSINTPWTSSIGRLFDAVAALVLGVAEVSYEGEAAAWLEAVADPAVADAYSLPLRDRHEATAGDKTVPRGDWRPMLSAILSDLTSGEDEGVIAARFHNALAQWAAAVATRQTLREVVLSGGCFQNRFLSERTMRALAEVNCSVYIHSQIPPGDGGLAVGQLAVAIAASGGGGV